MSTLETAMGKIKEAMTLLRPPVAV